MNRATVPVMKSTPSSVDMLKRLVAFDTTSRNSNLALIEDVRNYLGDLGVKSTLVPNAKGTKANLFASIGPEVEGGIVLSGHTDVVPVDGQPWTTDPWQLTEKDDANLYGRGTEPTSRSASRWAPRQPISSS